MTTDRERAAMWAITACRQPQVRKCQVTFHMEGLSDLRSRRHHLSSPAPLSLTVLGDFTSVDCGPWQGMAQAVTGFRRPVLLGFPKVGRVLRSPLFGEGSTTPV
jgi:hypothetical protein